jgi:hypothetical protein
MAMTQTDQSPYQLTTGTIFCAPRDETGLSAPTLFFGTDAEYAELMVLAPTFELPFFQEVERVPTESVEPAAEPFSALENRGGTEPSPDSTLDEDSDPELASLWDNPSDDEYNIP